MHDPDMFAHPYFVLWLHSDAWLSRHIGSTITHRHTVHEWPLSCVQRLHTIDGRSFFYKVQRPPSVEVAVYQHGGGSCLLKHVEVLEVHQSTQLPALLFHDENARPATLADIAATQRIHQLWAALAQLPQTLPVWATLDDWPTWQEYIATTLAMLAALLQSGRLQQVTSADVTHLATIALGEHMRAFYATTTMGVVHGDLHLGNLLVRNDELVIIDWQRPIKAPRIMDVVHFTAMSGGDLSGFPAVAVWYWALMRIDWLVRAGHTWFPAGCATYDGQIRHIIDHMHRLAPWD